MIIRFGLIRTVEKLTLSRGFRFFLHPPCPLRMVCTCNANFSTLIYHTGITVHWIFAPPNHGKGDCDSHGAVVKKGIRLFILNGMFLFCL